MQQWSMTGYKLLALVRLFPQARMLQPQVVQLQRTVWQVGFLPKAAIGYHFPLEFHALLCKGLQDRYCNHCLM